MKVTHFHHVSVNANDTSVDDMVAFYREVLGLGDADRPEIPGIAGHWHTVGESQLHLVGAPPSGNREQLSRVRAPLAALVAYR